MKVLFKIKYIIGIFVLSITLLLYNFSTANDSNSPEVKVLHLWSQVASNDTLSVRAIVEGSGKCPLAYVDDKKMEMTERALPDGESFPEKVCQLFVPRATKSVSINDQTVPVLKEKISKIAFIGDSGCIPPGGEETCNNETWPLKENLRSLSAHKPDLIAHLGDYNYKISPCFSDKSKCAECISNTDKFSSWEEEWLNPGKGILKEFPMLFIRGNHENNDSCSWKTYNAYKAWYRYFDVNSSVPQTRVNIKHEDDSWIFDTGSLQFYVLDSSCCDSDDYCTDPYMIEHYKEQFNFFNTRTSLDKPYWLITHKQFWHYNGEPGARDTHYVNENLVHAFKATPIKNISAIMSGHVHIAQIIMMDDAPTQIISGNGGGLLYDQDLDSVVQNVKFHTVDGLEFNAKEVLSFLGFGFAILDLDARKFSFYSKDNKELYSTSLTGDFRFTAPAMNESSMLVNSESEI